MTAVQSLKKYWLSSRIYRLIEHRVNRHFQRRLENDRFTILSSNCIGGVIYHRLGKQFLSPTLNTYMNQPDFVSFCLHLRHYLAQDLLFLAPEDNHRIVARLSGNGQEIPDVKVFFDHEDSQEAAAEGWYRRRARVNFDNLYIILYNLDGVTTEQLRMLEQVPCRNKVVLTASALPDIPWAFYIKPVMRHKFPYSYLTKNLFGIRYFERTFDFVSFLNHNGRSMQDVSE